MSVPHTILQASIFLDSCLNIGFAETRTRSVKLGNIEGTDVPTFVWRKIFYWIYGEHHIARPDTEKEARIMGKAIDFLMPREDTDEGKALRQHVRHLSEHNWPHVMREANLPVNAEEDLPHGILALGGTEFTVSGLVLASISTVWDKQSPVQLPATVSISALDEMMRIAHRLSGPAPHATSANLHEIIRFIRPPNNTEIGRTLLGMQQSHKTLQELPELYKDHPDIVTQGMLKLLNQVDKSDMRGVEGAYGESPKDYALLWGRRLDRALLPQGVLCFIESLSDLSDSSALRFFGVICQVIHNLRNVLGVLSSLFLTVAAMRFFFSTSRKRSRIRKGPLPTVTLSTYNGIAISFSRPYIPFERRSMICLQRSNLMDARTSFVRRMDYVIASAKWRSRCGPKIPKHRCVKLL